MSKKKARQPDDATRARVEELADKLYLEHSLDDYEKAELRMLVKKTGYHLNPVSAEYLGIKSKKRKAVFVAVILLFVVSVAAAASGFYMHQRQVQAEQAKSKADIEHAAQIKAEQDKAANAQWRLDALKNNQKSNSPQSSTPAPEPEPASSTSQKVPSNIINPPATKYADPSFNSTTCNTYSGSTYCETH